MKIFNLDLSIKVDRLKFIILMIGTGVFITIVSLFTYNNIRSPDFCIKCHVMSPEYYTWQASSHSNFKCVDCHISFNSKNGLLKGVKYSVSDAFSIIKNAVAFASDSYRLPVRMILPVEDYVCLKCHSEAREASPSGDLIIPHPIHKDKEVDCVRCHSGVAHGDIAERKVTITKSLDSWDEFLGKAQMEVQFARTPMDNCMQCHQRRSGPLDCDSCHTTSKKPMSHLNKGFLSTHGKQALNELDSCNLCHSYSGYVSGKEQLERDDSKLVSVKLLMPKKERDPKEVVKYSRDNQFCVKCHSKKPKSHELKSFVNYHAKEGKNESGTCFTCHSNRPEELNPVTNTTCASCHPSSHYNDNWKVSHPVEIKGKIQKSCFSCHSETTCTSCHTIIN